MSTSKVRFVNIGDVKDERSRYIVIDIAAQKLSLAIVDDNDTLPDGHQTKNMAVLSEASHHWRTCILALLQISEDGKKLYLNSVGMAEGFAIFPPNPQMKPIELASRQKGVWVRTPYTIFPFGIEDLIPLITWIETL